MPNNDLGEIRRSNIIQSGPGAIIDFRAGEKGGGPVSVICGGLEEWDMALPVKSLFTDPRVIRDTRLEHKLNKKYFRLPPAYSRNRGSNDTADEKGYIPAVRFPSWLQCPKCGALKPDRKWGSEIGDPSRWCSDCSKSDVRIYAVPTRFVLVCESGHLDDFPWQYYLRRTSGSRVVCPEGECRLALTSTGSMGLSGLLLVCTKSECGAVTNLARIFSTDSNSVFSTIKCRGQRPWLGDQEECGNLPRVIQRGASNMYFPVVESALCIPPWDDQLQTNLEAGGFWDKIVGAEDENTRNVLIELAASGLPGITVEDLKEQIQRRIEYLKNPGKQDLKKEEYKNFIGAGDFTQSRTENTDFQITSKEVPSEFTDYVERIVKVDRLKEVRVQTGFTRVKDPLSVDRADGGSVSPISLGDLEWLPGAVVRGEGIFVSIDNKRLDKWKGTNPAVVARCDEIRDAFLLQMKEMGADIEKLEFEVSPNFILLHTLSHILIRQLSLTSGYNAASIKERLFSGGENPEMNGILLYTGTSDSDGTLGGLSRQAETDLSRIILMEALDGAQWCASDPLCIDGISSISESHNKAACHACLLLPETSCERFNKFLDRALIVGTPGDPDIGFFSEMLKARHD